MIVDDDTFERKVLSLIAEAAGGNAKRAPIKGDKRLQRDLGIDSIGLLGLVVRFEEAFGLHLSDADLSAYVGRIRTVDDALSFGREMLRADAARPR